MGHVVRKGGLEKLVLEGKMDGRRSRGRKGQNYMEGLALAAGCGALDVFAACGRWGRFQAHDSHRKPLTRHLKTTLLVLR